MFSMALWYFVITILRFSFKVAFQRKSTKVGNTSASTNTQRRAIRMQWRTILVPVCSKAYSHTQVLVGRWRTSTNAYRQFIRVDGEVHWQNRKALHASGSAWTSLWVLVCGLWVTWHGIHKGDETSIQTFQTEIPNIHIVRWIQNTLIPRTNLKGGSNFVCKLFAVASFLDGRHSPHVVGSAISELVANKNARTQEHNSSSCHVC